MRQLTYTFKNVTLTFKFDRESKYHLDGDNVIQLDDQWMHRQCYLLWDRLSDKRSKVVRDYDNVLIAISENQFNSFKNSQDAWVERELKRFNVQPTGQVFIQRLASLKKGSK